MKKIRITTVRKMSSEDIVIMLSLLGTQLAKQGKLYQVIEAFRLIGDSFCTERNPVYLDDVRNFLNDNQNGRPASTKHLSNPK